MIPLCLPLSLHASRTSDSSPLTSFSLCLSLYLSHSSLKYQWNHLSDPVPMVAVVGVTLSLLILFLALVLALLVAYKKEKMCFKGEITFQSVSS